MQAGSPDRHLITTGLHKRSSNTADSPRTVQLSSKTDTTAQSRTGKKDHTARANRAALTNGVLPANRNANPEIGYSNSQELSVNRKCSKECGRKTKKRELHESQKPTRCDLCRIKRFGCVKTAASCLNCIKSGTRCSFDLQTDSDFHDSRPLPAAGQEPITDPDEMSAGSASGAGLRTRSLPAPRMPVRYQGPTQVTDSLYTVNEGSQEGSPTHNTFNVFMMVPLTLPIPSHRLVFSPLSSEITADAYHLNACHCPR